LGAQSATLFITADNIQSNLVYLTGIGANNGMSIEPSQLKFSYFDSVVSNQIMFDTLYDFNLDTNIQYVDSIKVQTSTPADTALFTVLGNFPVLIPAPSGPGKANGLRTPIAIIRFNGTNKVSPHYGYLQVYFRGAPLHPILVPLIAGPF
ncbi:MAG TPA: hypothetical protein VFJ29_05855, partial [Candidatus Kapabacteria bacterium]|nr:hypothetical protein [Candidatus Kapabacteria bacterium]